MQWGLTAENAEHIKQAKSAQVLKKSLHRKWVALNNSNMSDIPHPSSSSLQKIRATWNMYSPLLLIPSPQRAPQRSSDQSSYCREPQISAKICSSLKELQMRGENMHETGSKWTKQLSDKSSQSSLQAFTHVENNLMVWACPRQNSEGNSPSVQSVDFSGLHKQVLASSL